MTLALSAESDLLLLDEPLAGLSASWATDAVAMIATYLAEIRLAAFVVIEHRYSELGTLECEERSVLVDDDQVPRLV